MDLVLVFAGVIGLILPTAFSFLDMMWRVCPALAMGKWGLYHSPTFFPQGGWGPKEEGWHLNPWVCKRRAMVWTSGFLVVPLPQAALWWPSCPQPSQHLSSWLSWQGSSALSQGSSMWYVALPRWALFWPPNLESRRWPTVELWRYLKGWEWDGHG